MSAKSNMALIRHLYEEIDKGNAEVLDEVFASDFVDHGSNSASSPASGLAELREDFDRFAKAFSGSEHVIEGILAAGDRVVVHVRGRGIHRGEYMGVAPTGKNVSMNGIAIYRIAGGKVVEEWSQEDLLDFYRQLGLTEGKRARPAVGPARDVQGP